MATANSLDEGVPLRIEMWGDIQCLWCYVQREVLKLVAIGMGGAEIKFRTYSQFPHVHTGDSPPDDCFKEYHDAFGKVVAEMPPGYDCTELQRTDSQKAHELVHFASARGRAAEMVDRLFRAHFVDGLDVGELETLVVIAAQCDLDRNEVTVALQQGWCTAEVEQDNHLAYLLGVSGVPYATINGRYRLRGVCTPNAMREALAGARRSMAEGESRDMESLRDPVMGSRLTREVDRG